MRRDEEIARSPYREWHRAVDARDSAYDGVFVVALSSTRVCCRPSCPSRLAHPQHRRFFPTWAEAAAAGYRACRRCRPEEATSHAPGAAVHRLADAVIERIAAGALRAQTVQQLASSLGVSDRHVRRALQQAHGTTPARVAAEARLRAATALLADPSRSIASVARESGFGSVRRFNAAFRARVGMTPTAWRARGPGAPRADAPSSAHL